VMMAQGSGGQAGPGGPGNVGGAGNGNYTAPSFPTHYQQQFANQTNPQAAPAYRQPSYPPPVNQNQQQLHTAPSPSQYGQQGYPAQPSPANSSQGYGQATYNNPPYQQHRPTSSHHQQSQSPYADPALYASPASVGLGSPAIIVEHDPGMQASAPVQNARPIPAAPAGTDVELWQMYVWSCPAFDREIHADGLLVTRFSAMDIDQSGQLEANEVQALLAKDHRWANIEPREDCVKMVSDLESSLFRAVC
jgi:hypothetical protein